MCTLLGHLSWDSPRWPPSDSAGQHDHPAWLILYTGFPYLRPGSLGAYLSLRHCHSDAWVHTTGGTFFPCPSKSCAWGCLSGVSRLPPFPPHTHLCGSSALRSPQRKGSAFFFFFSLRDSESVAPKLPPVQWGPGSSVFQPVTFGTGSGSQPADPIAGGSSPPGSPVSARVHPL